MVRPTLFAFIMMAAALAGSSSAAEPALADKPSVEVLDGGIVQHLPSRLRLPPQVNGPSVVHRLTITKVSESEVEVVYGPITLGIARPAVAADPITAPPGFTLDDDAPELPSLRLWGETAVPDTYSFISETGGENWLAFVVTVEGWEIMISSSYMADHRDTAIGTAEAVWALFASANETEPR